MASDYRLTKGVISRVWHIDEEYMTTEKQRQLPWGLNPDSITPGSMKTISAEKLKAFSVGNMNSVRQKSSISKKKEELEERKRLEEQKQAKVYEEFVREFEHDAPKVKTFVKGDVINSESKASDKGKIYNPAGMKRIEELTNAKFAASASSHEPETRKPEKPKKKQKEQEKKKSNLELFKEELKQQQAEREERHRLKKLGIIPMSAPEMIGSGFEPAPTVREQLENRELGTTSLSVNMASKLSSLSYYDSAADDPHSTNLYVGNLSMKIDEEQLCKIFGQYGPLASIKIMWPRNDEERKRDRNCGFVAYMSRANAEKAQQSLNGHELEGYAIRVGWGSSVPIPPHPVYIPPHLAGEMNAGNVATTGLPFNALPRKTNVRAPLILPPNQHDANELLRECIVYVVVPHDKAMLNRINRMAQYVVNEGPMFEAMIMNKELNNDKFQFLFDNKCAEHCYYRWRLYSLLQGETFSTWRTEEFRMFKNGSMWKPPPRHSKADMKIIKKAIETGEVQKRGQLSNSQRDKLEDMLRSLTVERETIGNCMFWCLSHADAAQEVVECISESLSILQTPPTVKAARLFLCNDLLYNSCAEVQNASSYRTKLESKLADIVINLKATFDEIKTHTAREKFKSQVQGCLRAWREWNVYSPDYLAQLDLIFTGGRNKEVDVDEVDGVPLDVDGVPLAKDVDGEPLADEEEEDIFNMSPKKSSSKAPPLKSKWEDSGPSLGSKWEKSTASPSLGSKWESSDLPKKSSDTSSKSSDEKRKKKREIEVKVAEYVDKLESGKCTRIKQITTNEQAEIYRYLLCKGKDAKKKIKHIATGRESLTELQSEMKSNPLSSPVLVNKTAGLGGLVSYGSSPTSSPEPEPKRKREHSDKKKRSLSPKHERKKKSRH